MSAKVKTKTKVKMTDNIYDANYDMPQEYAFNNVFRLKDNEWTTVLSGKQLANMWLDRKILFHPDCQRGIKLERRNGVLQPKAVCSRKNIREIKNDIVSGDYSPDEITLNILDDKKSKIEVEDNTMIAEGLMFVTDGQHRLKSLAELEISNNILGEDTANISNKFFNVKITNYTLEKAGEVFAQLTKGLRISKSLAESFNKKDSVNRIVSTLNRTSVLEDKIDTIKTSIVKSDTKHLTTFATLSMAIKDSYGDISDPKMEENVLDFLKEFFKELTNIFPEMLNDEERQLSKNHSLICENFMMYCWIELSQLLYCKRFSPTWREELSKIENIDFYKLNIKSEEEQHGDEDEELNPIWSSILRMTTNGTVSIVNNSSTRQTARRIIKEQFYLAQN